MIKLFQPLSAYIKRYWALKLAILGISLFLMPLFGTYIYQVLLQTTRPGHMTSVSWTGITIDKRQDTTHSVERQVVGAEVFWFKPSTQLVSFDDFLQLDEEYYRIIDDVAIPRRLGPDWEVEQGSPPETVTTYDLPYIKLALGMVSPIREQRGHIWGVKSTRSTTIELFDVSKIDGKVMTYAPALRIADSPIMFEYADETYSEF